MYSQPVAFYRRLLAYRRVSVLLMLLLLALPGTAQATSTQRPTATTSFL